jgi:hypothetical protein
MLNHDISRPYLLLGGLSQCFTLPAKPLIYAIRLLILSVFWKMIEEVLLVAQLMPSSLLA